MDVHLLPRIHHDEATISEAFNSSIPHDSTKWIIKIFHCVSSYFYPELAYDRWNSNFTTLKNNLLHQRGDIYARHYEWMVCVWHHLRQRDVSVKEGGFWLIYWADIIRWRGSWCLLLVMLGSPAALLANIAKLNTKYLGLMWIFLVVSRLFWRIR